MHYVHTLTNHYNYLITTIGTVMFLLSLASTSSPKTRSNSTQEYLSIKQTVSRGALTDTSKVRQQPSLEWTGFPLCSTLSRPEKKGSIMSHFIDNKLRSKSTMRSVRWKISSKDFCQIFLKYMKMLLSRQLWFQDAVLYLKSWMNTSGWIDFTNR